MITSAPFALIRIGTLVNLQFEDIYRIWHVHHGISLAYGALYLCADIDVEETEHQIAWQGWK